jgi:hypothetical protein
MLILEHLENNQDLEKLLEPKKKIHDLVTKINGSMLEFHKTVKDSKELEALADEFFNTKSNIIAIKSRSVHIDMYSLNEKISKLKNIKSSNIDFI